MLNYLSFTQHITKSTLVLLLLSLLLTILIYSPGLSGGFVFDDFSNIVENEALKIDSLEKDSLTAAALSGHAGPLKRPISVLSFALNYYATGDFSPYYFKITNLIIHLINGVGLFLLVTLILTAYKQTTRHKLEQQHIYFISLVVSTVWLIHPINLTSVLYVVQRMNSLSSLFIIWGLVFFAWGRIRLISGQSGIHLILVSFTIFWILATLSKENGILLPVFMLALELTLFNFATQTKKSKYVIQGLFGITVLLPIIIFLIIATQSQWLTTPYITRDFSLIERLLTESRVLWFYISLILIPTQARLGLFHDDITLSTSLIDPISTLFACMGIALILAIALYFRKRTPILSLGILFFLFGHSLESSVFALDIAYEHRNYLPSFGLILAATFYILLPLSSEQKKFLIQKLISVTVIILLSVITLVRADYWGHPLKHANTEALHHPNSPRANIFLGIAYAKLAETNPNNSEQLFTLATKHLQAAADLDHKNTIALFNLIASNQNTGKELNTNWVEKLLHRIEHKPFTQSTLNGIKNVMFCINQNKCPSLKNIIKPIFDASLRNPGVSGRTKAEILTMAGMYASEALNDNESALYLIAQAAETTPNIAHYRLNLVTFLYNIGRFDDAEKELKTASKVDVLRRYTRSIKQHRKNIFEARLAMKNIDVIEN